MRSSIAPAKDEQTVTPAGAPVGPLVDGVIMHYVPPQEDERGEVVEIWNLDWPGFDDPVVHAYKVVTRPGKARAWQMHLRQDDRVLVSRGRLRIGLYDDRQGSPTRGLLNVFTLSDHQRAIVRIPRGSGTGCRTSARVRPSSSTFPPAATTTPTRTNTAFLCTTI